MAVDMREERTRLWKIGRQRGRWALLLLALGSGMAFPMTGMAAGASEVEAELGLELPEGLPEKEKVEEELLGELDFSSVQRAMEEALQTELDFSQTVTQAMEGESLLSPTALGKQVLGQLQGEWARQKGTFLSVLVLSICAALLTNFSSIFKNQQIAEVSFEIAYMLLFLTLLRSFSYASEVTETVLGGMQDFMKALVPAYFLSVSMACSPVTAGVFFPFVLGVIYLIQWLMEFLLLPLLDGYVILVFINHLTKEEYLSQLSEAVAKGIGWVLKSLLALVAGFHVIQGMVTPAVDSFKTTLVSRAAAAIPGVGNLAGSVTDVLLGSGILIKNGIGAAGLVVLLFICLVPVIQLGIWVLLLEVLAAIVQPVSDKRMTGCISGISDAGKLLLRMVFTVAVLFMLTIAVVAVSTGLRS
ncbi:MAG: stage III sporulation protein AF [Lachnospiraceae bacterium]|nr:stage III sporulation protein AF [Lachnospiraceae bacterium]